MMLSSTPDRALEGIEGGCGRSRGRRALPSLQGERAFPASEDADAAAFGVFQCGDSM